MSIKPRDGCDPDVVAMLSDLQADLGDHQRKVVAVAVAEIEKLRALLALYDDGIRPQPDKHADSCECADCWREMEGRG